MSIDRLHRTDKFIPTRQSLLSRLKDWDDQKSWREFFDAYGELIYNFARRSGLNDSESQDVVQETMLSVAEQMGDFKYDPQVGTFKSWLRQVTRRRIVDQFRKRLPEEQIIRQEMSGEPLENLPDSSCDFESIWEEEWQDYILKSALRKVKRKVHPKQFQIFDLYVTQHWPMKSVVQTLGVSCAQVYMAKMRISRMLKEEIRILKQSGAA